MKKTPATKHMDIVYSYTVTYLTSRFSSEDL
jgi:hypothetical protein